MNIIKDTESKKKEEISFYEARMADMQGEVRSMQS